MLWYVLCASIVLIPVFMTMLLFFTVRLAARLDARRAEESLQEIPSQQPRGDRELLPATAALEAQFLLAPGKAIQEAQEYLRSLGVSPSPIDDHAPPDVLRLTIDQLVGRIEQLQSDAAASGRHGRTPLGHN